MAWVTFPRMNAHPRHPRREAQEVLGEGFEARVLEPSPPAVVDGEWFADDPVDCGTSSGRPVVGPVAGCDLTWDEWLRDRPERADWAAARWLGAHRRLPPPPAALTATRRALHRLAEVVISPARERVNGKIALRYTFGGFGTPFFGADEQIRIVGDQIVRQRGDQADAQAITTLREAAEFVLGESAGEQDEELAVDAEAAAFLGDWYGFAYSVLEELRADPASTEASRVQLWPEHFDAAVECLPEPRRAGFGASPGDEDVEEPYVYVVPWNADAAPASALWNAESFRGGILPLRQIVDAPDQRAAALTFLRERRALLVG